MDLYGLLHVEKRANAEEIRKAYYALARKVHPDKNPGDEGAADAFRALKKAYDVLRDPQRRARYDKAGSVGDDVEESAFQEAYERYKTVEISEEDIEEFVGGYKESSAERADVLAYAKRHKGDVTRILESIIGSEDDDADRYCAIIQEALDEKKLSFGKKTRAKFEATRHEILGLEELDGEDLSDEDDEENVETPKAPVEPSTDLLAMFAARRERRESAFAKFEEKWQAVTEDEARAKTKEQKASPPRNFVASSKKHATAAAKFRAKKRQRGATTTSS